jgi:hypothetical protein
MSRIQVRTGLFLGVGILLLAAMPVLAQGNATCTVGSGAYNTYGVNGKVGTPFSGTTRTTFEQTLADGSRIYSETTSFQARDSAGRVRTEQVEDCQIGEDGQPHPRVRVEISDPTTHSNLMWETGENTQKVVQVFHYDPTPRKATPEELAEMQRQMKLNQLRWQSQSRNRTETQLGTREINGQLAKGNRMAVVVPAGAEGNDQPLETVQEMWKSDALDLTLMATSSDPRRGKTTFEYEDLTLAEPDPGLFKAPDGYRVIDQHPEQ